MALRTATTQRRREGPEDRGDEEEARRRALLRRTNDKTSDIIFFPPFFRSGRTRSTPGGRQTASAIPPAPPPCVRHLRRRARALWSHNKRLLRCRRAQSCQSPPHRASAKLQPKSPTPQQLQASQHSLAQGREVRSMPTTRTLRGRVHANQDEALPPFEGRRVHARSGAVRLRSLAIGCAMLHLRQTRSLR